MSAIIDLLERLPVATIVHLVVAVVLGADLIVHGSLSSDAVKYASIVTVGNGTVAIGRGLAALKSAPVLLRAASAAAAGTVSEPAPVATRTRGLQVTFQIGRR